MEVNLKVSDIKIVPFIWYQPLPQGKKALPMIGARTRYLVASYTMALSVTELVPLFVIVPDEDGITYPKCA